MRGNFVVGMAVALEIKSTSTLRKDLFNHLPRGRKSVVLNRVIAA